jgi:K+-transporting ATPase A subunit
MFKYDALVYMALGIVILTIIIAAVVVGKTPETTELETRKIRVATVTLTGLLILFLFVSVLYFVDPTGAGKEIFDKAYTAMLTLAGAISGYIFGAKSA